MSIAALFREIFLRLNTLAEQLKNGLAGLRDTAAQTPDPGSGEAETVEFAELPPSEPQELPADREPRTLSDAELADIAGRIADRLPDRRSETAAGTADKPLPTPDEERLSEPQIELPPLSIPPETVREIAELTAEKLAVRDGDPAPPRPPADTPVTAAPDTKQEERPAFFPEDLARIAELTAEKLAVRREEPARPEDTPVTAETETAREDRPAFLPEDLTRIAELTAEKLAVRREEPPRPADTPVTAEIETRREERPAFSPEDLTRIAELTAEKFAARFEGREPSAGTAAEFETAMSELSAKLDTILAAVKSNGEQIRKIAEIDTNTIFFS